MTTNHRCCWCDHEWIHEHGLFCPSCFRFQDTPVVHAPGSLTNTYQEITAMQNQQNKPQVQTLTSAEWVAGNLKGDLHVGGVKVTNITEDVLARACNLAGLDYSVFLKIKAYLPVDGQSLEKSLHAVWADAYSAFKGAFDTPLARRKMSDEFSEDARKRLREFDEMMQTLSK